VSEKNMLGDYLRARRELIQPESVGLPVTGVRRVAGLRREEVAMLAGISSDYYLRLEQGRDRNPSVQVLEALARVLGLDQVATEFNRYAPKSIVITTPALRSLQISGVFTTDDTAAFVAFLRSLEGVRVEETASQIVVSRLNVPRGTR